VRALALVPAYVAGLCVGAWLFAAPWVVGFSPGRHGAWGMSTWSSVWAGAIVLGASAVALVVTVGLALAGAPHRDAHTVGE
jgi:hypothetical protein